MTIFAVVHFCLTTHRLNVVDRGLFVGTRIHSYEPKG